MREDRRESDPLHERRLTDRVSWKVLIFTNSMIVSVLLVFIVWAYTSIEGTQERVCNNQNEVLGQLAETQRRIVDYIIVRDPSPIGTEAGEPKRLLVVRLKAGIRELDDRRCSD